MQKVGDQTAQPETSIPILVRLPHIHNPGAFRFSALVSGQPLLENPHQMLCAAHRSTLRASVEPVLHIPSCIPGWAGQDCLTSTWQIASGPVPALKDFLMQLEVARISGSLIQGEPHLFVFIEAQRGSGPMEGGPILLALRPDICTMVISYMILVLGRQQHQNQYCLGRYLESSLAGCSVPMLLRRNRDEDSASRRTGKPTVVIYHFDIMNRLQDA
ncbi:hypothetical protein QBC37DRAFT_485524 [Rhypophila decipiens]|uniref:Uncharacterized protein n=1 Tax=Rhypophila decipiens TaxID=261697 RepID=A0AAN6Y0N1_9PEZI|nr:hypothetical protein QBC37DRAFT_485524 [Rhypophila decipiens]